MKRSIRPIRPTRPTRWLWSLAALAACALLLPGNGAAQDPAPDPAELAPGVSLGEPTVFRNLALYPISAADADADGVRYITLDEGSAAGLVVVTETGGGDTMEMNNNNVAPQNDNANPPVNQQDEQQQQVEDEDPFARLRAMVEQLGHDNAPSMLQIQIETIRLQKAEIERERQQLMPQGRDISQDMAALAEREAALNAALTALQNAAGPREQLRQQLMNEPQQQQEMNQDWPQQQQARGGRSGATVNSLHVANKSDRALFLMTGELLLGGQQDRIVAVDTVIPAGEEADVKVFCVEHGRWNGEARFGSGNAMVHGKLRCVAQASKSQQQVWDEVEQTNGKLGTDADNDTGTYRGNLTDEEVAKAAAEYRAYIDAHFVRDEHTIGVAVAYRGEVHVIDRFGSTAMFHAMIDKLLTSYVMAAIIEAAEYKAAHPDAEVDAEFATPTAAQVVEFYHQATAAPASDDDNGQTLLHATRQENDKAVGFRAERVEEAEGEGQKRQLLHENWFRK